MKAERMIEILAEEMKKEGLYSSDSIEVLIRHILRVRENEYETAALTAMQRAVEEALADKEQDYQNLIQDHIALQRLLQLSDLTRLRECEAIVRELAEGNVMYATAREWVKNNPK